ncbi:pentapeptide repeat-containing protein [Amycolatopsis thailandensis]|uniref:pentapeptide repeat-containing protein n=1 Tax=Amycolatopsis thailandensis TaxID=589330 RepID=UPI0036472E05
MAGKVRHRRLLIPHQARFDQATFAGEAWFRKATFAGGSRFYEARFEVMPGASGPVSERTRSVIRLGRCGGQPKCQVMRNRCGYRWCPCRSFPDTDWLLELMTVA